MIKRIVTISALLLFLGTVFAFDIPNYEGYVTDTVGVFSATEKADLTSRIEGIEKTTSIEIAILVVPTVDDDINLAAVDVGNARGVGKKGQDNGLMLLIAVNDKKRSIQVGYGLEGTLPDLITKRIGEARFPTNFREGNYYQGITQMLDDVSGYLKQDPTIVKTYSQESSSSYSDKTFGRILILLIILIGLFGRFVTLPSLDGKTRKMKKYGRWMYTVAGIFLSLALFRVLANIILSIFLAYFLLLIGVFSALYGKPGHAIRFGGGGGSRGGGSGFGGFGGGSFGGGGSSGSR